MATSDGSFGQPEVTCVFGNNETVTFLAKDAASTNATFAVGNTTVTCVASDDPSHVSDAVTFEVTVSCEQGSARDSDGVCAGAQGRGAGRGDRPAGGQLRMRLLAAGFLGGRPADHARAACGALPQRARPFPVAAA